jgi:hypothetical protein
MLKKVLAVLAAIALTVSVIIMTEASRAVMAQDKCFTQQDRTTGIAKTNCFPEDHKTPQQQKQVCKETAKETNSKCSSSQTGQGLFGNFLKHGTFA